MLEAALAGERLSFAATFDHPTPRAARGAERLHRRGSTPRPAPSTASSSSSPTSPSSGSTEVALRESEARFRRIANSAPAMMWVTRLDRVRDFVNDAYVEFAGGPERPRGGADARLARRGSTPTTSSGSSPRASPARRRWQRFTLEGRYMRHDGEYRWLRSVSQPRLGRGRRAGRVHRGRRPTSPWPRRPSSSSGARSRSRPRSWRRARRSSARSSRRRWR